MTGPERRTAIINQIKTSSAPVPGKALAAQYEVSRQVIVQDIALIRAAGHDIISTNRGYILHESHLVERIFKVKHTDNQVEERHDFARVYPARHVRDLHFHDRTRGNPVEKALASARPP